MSRIPIRRVTLASLIAITILCGSVGAGHRGAETGHQLRASYRGYACFWIDSDPREAYVYGEDGTMWGKTGDDAYVEKIFKCGSDDGKEVPCNDFSYTITLKRRGYKATKHKFKVHYERDPPTLTCQKIVVVLDENE